MSQHAIQYICGCISGWAQVLTTQPLEIIKVRLANQSLSNPTYHGIFDCIRKIYTQQGPSAFFKGMLSPLLGAGPLVSIYFGTYQALKKIIAKKNHSQLQSQQNIRLMTKKIVKNLDMKFIFLSGFLTGIPIALVVTPVDHMRIKMQILNNTKYKSSIDVGMKIYSKFGIRGLYQGFYPTLLGQVIGSGIYFAIYEGFIRKFGSSNEGPPSTIISFTAGGLAGSISWLLTYPLDYIKTIIQSDDTQNRKFRNSFDASRIKFKEEGIKTFFKGLGITLLRTFPVNGVGFVTFQYLRHYLQRMTFLE